MNPLSLGALGRRGFDGVIFVLSVSWNYFLNLDGMM
jgi:hypothetical protein